MLIIKVVCCKSNYYVLSQTIAQRPISWKCVLLLLLLAAVAIAIGLPLSFELAHFHGVWSLNLYKFNCSIPVYCYYLELAIAGTLINENTGSHKNNNTKSNATEDYNFAVVVLESARGHAAFANFFAAIMAEQFSFSSIQDLCIIIKTN